MCIARIAEELFPFAYYHFINARRVKARSALPEILEVEPFREYSHLPQKVLERRLVEEHERAAALDDKTLKVTPLLVTALSLLSVGLTVIGFFSSSLIPKSGSSLFLTDYGLPILFVLSIGSFVLSIGCFIFAGLTALGAMHTQPRYGYGTEHELHRHDSNSTGYLAEQLARQEALNFLCQCRNVAVFQTTRNGIILLLVGVLFLLVDTVLRVI